MKGTKLLWVFALVATASYGQDAPRVVRRTGPDADNFVKCARTALALVEKLAKAKGIAVPTPNFHVTDSPPSLFFPEVTRYTGINFDKLEKSFVILTPTEHFEPAISADPYLIATKGEAYEYQWDAKEKKLTVKKVDASTSKATVVSKKGQEEHGRALGNVEFAVTALTEELKKSDKYYNAPSDAEKKAIAEFRKERSRALDAECKGEPLYMFLHALNDTYLGIPNEESGGLRKDDHK